jgi:predicted transcriptional regulator of viral defense system
MAHAVRGRHDLDTIVNAVKREYDEMPGLALTVEQAQRLWALEPRMCRAALGRLVDVGYLCRTEGGQFAKPSVA